MEMKFKLPERNMLACTPYICEGIKAGQNAVLDGKFPIFIIEGFASVGIRRQAAGALAFGATHKDYVLPAFTSEDLDQDIANELAELDFDEDDRWAVKSCEENEMELGLINLKLMKEQDHNNPLASNGNNGHGKIVLPSVIEVRDGMVITGSLPCEVESEVEQFLTTFLMNPAPIIIDIPSISNNLKKHLEFTWDAIRVNVKEPTLQEYAEMVRVYMTNSKVEVDDRVDFSRIVLDLKTFRAERFNLQSDLEHLLRKAKRSSVKEHRNTLVQKDFIPGSEKREDPEEKLNQLIGCEDLKKKLINVMKTGRFDMERNGLDYRHSGYHMLFAGNPGTGKTEFGKLFAEILEKYGLSNGIYRYVTKTDIIGKYVGWTTEKVSELFNNTRGGVLFFDEASAFLTNDDFTKEALTELVRYMEEFPDVTCIFATYPDEANKFLKADPGLRSRISQILEFEDYSPDDLYKILCYFCGKDNFELEDCQDVFEEYVKAQKAKHGAAYGNARLCRKFYVKLKEAIAEDTYEKRRKPSEVNLITRETVKKAIKNLELLQKQERKNPIGFTTGGTRLQKGV